MLYYFGKGKEFKKEECKEYKTLDGARKAFDKAVAAGTEATVWDENGVVVIGMTDNVPEGAATVAAVTGNTGAGDGQQENAGTSTGDAGAATDSGNDNGRGNMPPEPENGQNGANTQPQQGENTGEGDGQQENTGASGDSDSGQQGNVSESDTVIVPQETMKVTVICDGTLNLRRSPHWGNTNICGRASRGQSYYVKEIHTVDGKKMVRTIDDLYLSGASEHVRIEQF